VNLHHFYHVYATGDWEEPLTEHLAMLGSSGLGGELRTLNVGIVGPKRKRDAVKMMLAHMAHVHLRFDIVAEEDDGWEQVTMIPLSHFVQRVEGAILYAHTKGAGDPTPINIAWRRSMTKAVVRDWRKCISILDGTYSSSGPTRKDIEAVGCHWLTPEAYPALVGVPYFGGTFWWARTEFLRMLPEPSMESRYEAEAWLGRGPRRPHVVDLAPGWPGFANFIS